MLQKNRTAKQASSTLTAHQVSLRSVALHKATVDCLNSKHSYHQLNDSASKSAVGECVMRADTTCSLFIVCLCVKAPGVSNGTFVRTSVKVRCDSWVAHKVAAKSKHNKRCAGVELMSLKISEHLPNQASRVLTVYAYVQHGSGQAIMHYWLQTLPASWQGWKTTTHNCCWQSQSMFQGWCCSVLHSILIMDPPTHRPRKQENHVCCVCVCVINYSPLL